MANVITDEQNFIDIANSIREKNGTTNTYKPSEMSDAILAITTGIDTSDATATAIDIADGKTAYVNGEKVTGLLGEVANGETLNYVPDGVPTFKEDVVYGVSLTAKMAQDTLLRRQSYFNITANSSDFGDATPADVISGKTFTSTSGIKVAGTLSSSTGIDTSDATASATDIANGKTAYVNRDKITGTLNEISAGTFQLNTSTPREYASDTFVVSNTVGQDRILRDGVEIRIPMKRSSFGDAIAEDVASGKTFTSSNGLCITGTSTGIDTSDATATSSDILSGKTAYINGSKVEGVIVTKISSDLSSDGATVTVPAGYYASQVSKSVVTVTQATPTISVDSSGLITASTTQDVGYVEAGTKTATNQLSVQSAQTITPSTSNQIITSCKYLTGDQTILGDANLVASNIKNGVNIFGVTGTLNTGVDTSDATATASDILSSKTAYVNGSKVTGTIKTVEQATPSISVNSSGLITASATQSTGYVSNGTKSATKQLTTQAAQTITPGTTNKTIASGRYLTGTQTIKGDANLVAANIKSGVSIFGVTGTMTGGNGTVSVGITNSTEYELEVQYVDSSKSKEIYIASGNTISVTMDRCSIIVIVTDSGYASQSPSNCSLATMMSWSKGSMFAYYVGDVSDATITIS